MTASPELPLGWRRSLVKRVFAWMISRSSNHCSPGGDERKQELFREIQGPILEIGPGAGTNLVYFPAVVEWTGVEPNPFMRPYLERTIQTLGLARQRFRVHPGNPGGTRLPGEDGSVRTVVSTHVLCSVPNLAGSLAEILRVLQPGGQFLFIEHVAAPRGSGLRGLQNFLQPLWSEVADGCHPNRETWLDIERAGFDRVEIEHFRFSAAGPVGPHIAGVAWKGV